MLHPPLHLGVVAIGKGAFGSLSIKVAKFTYIIIIIIIYLFIYSFRLLRIILISCLKPYNYVQADNYY